MAVSTALGLSERFCTSSRWKLELHNWRNSPDIALAKLLALCLAQIARE
jgi:hypothetical protein